MVLFLLGTYFTASLLYLLAIFSKTFPSLQMQYPVLNLLGPSLIPELGSDISTGSSRYKELILIPVATVRAFPYQLSGLVLDGSASKYKPVFTL